MKKKNSKFIIKTRNSWNFKDVEGWVSKKQITSHFEKCGKNINDDINVYFYTGFAQTKLRSASDARPTRLKELMDDYPKIDKYVRENFVEFLIGD